MQLAYEIGQYLDNPSNARVSPEAASRWRGDAPGSHGSLQPGYYLQGRQLGAMLDMVVLCNWEPPRGSIHPSASPMLAKLKTLTGPSG